MKVSREENSKVDLLHLDQPYRNTPIVNNFFETKPLAASMGAEVIIDDIMVISEEAFVELKKTLYHHKMIFFRDQDLTPENQKSFTLKFGSLGIDAYTSGLPDYPDIQPVIKEASTQSPLVFGGGWHTDSPFLEKPPAISLLYGIEVPPYGGDTIWYNSVLAYESLSQGMKNILKPLKVHMSGEKVVDAIQKSTSASENQTMGDVKMSLSRKKIIEGKIHPMVRQHPESHERSLFIDDVYSKAIVGLSDYESKPLLNFLVSHITQEIFSCRLRWERGTLAIWDNRICLHRAFNDYDGFRREMHRTTVEGEKPVQAI